jgi:Spy/CpxP family protein refolding chaperone
MRFTGLHRLRICFLLLTSLVAAGAVSAGPMDLSPEKREQMKSLAMDMRRETLRERDELMRARWALFQVYLDYDLDDRKAKAAQERIDKSQRDLLNAYLDHQLAIRRILNREEFESLWSRIGSRGGSPMMAGQWYEEGSLDHLLGKIPPDRLGLPPNRLKAIKNDQLGPRRRKVMEDLKRDTRRLIELYSSYDLDANAARKLIESIHGSQRDLADLNHKRQHSLRSALTREQFERLSGELVKKMRERRPGRRPGQDP